MIFSGASCSKSADDTSGGGGTATVPDVYKKIYGASSITSDGTYITIKTSGAPDHKSVYYPTANSLYEAFSGTSYFAEEDFGFSRDSSQFLHTEHILLIDKQKRIRGIYNGTLQLETEQLAKDIEMLKKEG
jgi:hypothetical protein